MAPIGSVRSGILGSGVAIPDTSVSRPDDDTSTNDNNDVGILFTVTQDWIDFSAEISSLHQPASDELLVIGDANGNDVATLDISGNTSGDVVTFSDVNLASGNQYTMYGRTSNSRQRGFATNLSFPFTSSDGNLSIDSGYSNGSTASSTAYAVKQIGNI